MVIIMVRMSNLLVARRRKAVNKGEEKLYMSCKVAVL